jgi:hypothetical protein
VGRGNRPAVCGVPAWRRGGLPPSSCLPAGAATAPRPSEQARRARAGLPEGDHAARLGLSCCSRPRQVIRTTGLGVPRVSPGDTDNVPSMRSACRPSALPGLSGPRDRRGWPLRDDDRGLTTLPSAGQLGHGRTASLRRRPTRMVEGRVEGGYTDAFELICCQRGDDPTSITPRPHPASADPRALQRTRTTSG